MRKLHGAVFISLDGVMQGPGGPEEDPTGEFKFGGWTAPFWDESMEGPMSGLFEGEFDLLLGRRTYEIFAGYWPHNRDHPIGEKFQQIRKYVVSSSGLSPDWEGSEALNGDPAETVAALKQRDGPDLLIQGSSQLYDALLPAGLVDRLTLIKFPVILGSGKRLFSGDSAEAGRWALKEQHVSESGVIMASYEPAGEVQTGTFETKEPSAEEIERRRKMAERDTW